MIQFFNKFTDPKTPYSNHIDLNDWYEGTNEELQQIDAGRHAPETVQSKDALLALVREKCAASPTCYGKSILACHDGSGLTSVQLKRIHDLFDKRSVNKHELDCPTMADAVDDLCIEFPRCKEGSESIISCAEKLVEAKQKSLQANLSRIRALKEQEKKRGANVKCLEYHDTSDGESSDADSDAEAHPAPKITPKSEMRLRKASRSQPKREGGNKATPQWKRRRNPAHAVNGFRWVAKQSTTSAPSSHGVFATLAHHPSPIHHFSLSESDSPF